MFDLEILHKENILPVLPLMNRWAIEAFQKPPYSFAGARANDLVDPQDLFYVNDPKSIVVVAKSRGQIIGIAAGIAFDSRDLQSYFESRHEGAINEIVKAGFDPTQMFYLTYILTSEFKEKTLLSCCIFDAIQAWATHIGKNQICWQEDVTPILNLDTRNTEKIETWKEDVGGFIKMGVQFKFCWPTRQLDESIKEAEHTMEFFYRQI